MTHELAVPLVLAALVAGAVVWARAAHDPVGVKPRERRSPTGLQGRLGEWLRWDAPLDRPDPSRLDERALSATTPPAHRALLAVVRREALEAGVSLAEAHGRLRASVHAPVARAFLLGDMRRAARAHWRGRYRGPDGLFPLWYILVAVPRYGRRRIVLETLAHAMQEMRT